MAKGKLPSGTWVERTMFESLAFLALRGSAPQLLILFLAKRQFTTMGRKGKEQRVCTNCDSLTFAYVEAKKKYGLTIPRIARAIDDLLRKGFLTIMHSGGAYKQDKSIYGFSDKWQSWTPGTVFEKRPKDRVQRGFRSPSKKK